MKVANQLVKDRKAGKSSSTKAESKTSDSKEKTRSSSSGSKSQVIELTEVNFNALVMDSTDHWLGKILKYIMFKV